LCDSQEFVVTNSDSVAIISVSGGKYPIMSLEDQVRTLSTMTTKDDAGRHFTQRYADAEIAQLEELGLIEIARPVHEATGLSYHEQHWTVEVTPAGVELVAANPEFWG
jgi:hypothetical protein